jgi:hypothetical protein
MDTDKKAAEEIGRNWFSIRADLGLSVVETL